MKNASQIINSLQNRPQFSRLSKYSCIKKISSLFTPTLQKMIKFGYFKSNTLFFVLNHPAAKQEFDNNIQTIKNALNFCKPEECSDEHINNIKAFVTHTPIKKASEVKIIQLRYKERATGDFKIDVKNEKLKTLIQSIQKIIKDKNDT